MSGIFLKFSAAKTGGASAANVKYITRETATAADERALYMHNLDQLKGQDYRETRTNSIAYAEARLDAEQARSRTNPKESRTHYRAILSFDRTEDTDKAREMAKEWLQKNFKDGRAIVSIHQDRDHTHAHVWIEARDLKDKKLQLDNRAFKNLDTSWARIYAKEYGKHYLKEHMEKKQETKNYRKALREGRHDMPRPNRARQDKQTIFIERERNNYGYNQNRLGNNQHTDAVRLHVTSTRESDLRGAAQANDAAAREANGAIQETQKLHNSLGKAHGDNKHANRKLNETVRELETTRSRFAELGGRIDRLREDFKDEPKRSSPER
jgi:hypothetical protein